MSKKYSDLEKVIGISVLGALLGYSASKFMKPKTSTTTNTTTSAPKDELYPIPSNEELRWWAIFNW